MSWLDICCFWYGDEGSPYDRMSAVWKATALAKSQADRIDAVRGHAVVSDRSEAFKLKAHDWLDMIRIRAHYAHDAETNYVLGLFDADTFFQRSVRSIMKHAFDIAVTRDHKGRLNSGVLYVRPSKKVSEFFAQWPTLTAYWCARNTPGSIRYGDQDALERMLKAPGDLKILTLPMREWNSTQRTWHVDLDKARTVHFKSGAREHVFEGKPCNELSLEVARRWQELERSLSHGV